VPKENAQGGGLWVKPAQGRAAFTVGLPPSPLFTGELYTRADQYPSGARLSTQMLRFALPPVCRHGKVSPHRLRAWVGVPPNRFDFPRSTDTPMD